MPQQSGSPASGADDAPPRWRLRISASSTGSYPWKMRVAPFDAADEARRARIAPVLAQVKRLEVLAALPPAMKRRPQMASFAEVAKRSLAKTPGCEPGRAKNLPTASCSTIISPQCVSLLSTLTPSGALSAPIFVGLPFS